MSINKTVSAPPCPFWRAASTDQRHVDPNAPAPLQADKKNDIKDAVEHLMYHGGFSKVKATAIAELLVVAANKGTFGKLRGLFTQTFTPNHLSDGLLDKELDSGLLRRVDQSGTERVGEFSEKALVKMFSAENSSEVMVDGQKMRAMNADQLTAFVDKNKSAVGAGRVHTFMANAEMKTLLLGIFGRTADSGEKVITQKDVEVFYDKAIFPHARLDAQVAQAYPAEVGAALATDTHDPVAMTQMMGTQMACPFNGGGKGDEDGKVQNPAFVDPQQAMKQAAASEQNAAV